MQFVKYHGLGNDFILVDERDGRTPLTAEQARALCDRRRGVGADGVLCVRPASPPAQVAMHIYNADGSVPQMCGNGLRCFALHLQRTSDPVWIEPELAVQTLAGVHRCRRGAPGTDGEWTVEVSMGPARLSAPDLPSPPGAAEPAPVALPAGLAGWGPGYPASMGNPHVVLFGPPLERAALTPGGEVLEWAARIQRWSGFPEGVNVGFAHVVDSTRLALVVVERGAGLTEACGTGACAAAVVARRLGLVDAGAATRVQLPGGALWVREGDGEVWMRGGATHVFDGALPGGAFESK